MKFKYLLAFTIFLTYYKCDARNNQQILEEKTQRLIDLTENNAVLSLDADTFEEFVESSPRNYSIIVLFPANPSIMNYVLNNYLYTEFRCVATAMQAVKIFHGKLFFAAGTYGVMTPPIYKVFTNTLYIVHYPPYGRPGYKDFMMSTIPNSISKAMFAFIEAKSKIILPQPAPTSKLTDFKVWSLGAMFIFYLGYSYIYCDSPDFWQEKKTWAVLGIFCSHCLYVAITLDPYNVDFLMNIGFVFVSITVLYLIFILFMHFFINPYSFCL